MSGNHLMCALLGLVIILPVPACGPTERNGKPDSAQVLGEFGPVGVSAAQIARLRVGMTIYEASDALKPSLPMVLSVPALIYDGVDGGQYYLVCYDESASQPGESDGLLRYVVLFPNSQMKDGKYVLPQERRGEAYRLPKGPGEK